MKIFFFALDETTKNFFSKQNILLILFGFLLTYVLVVTGFDWNYYLYFHSLNVNKFLFPAIVLGGLLPILLPVLLLFIGVFKKDVSFQTWAALLGQAAFLGWFTSSFLKAFTGRVEPNAHDLLTNISANFNFGFWEYGIFWGWPSSHTTVIFSVVTAVCLVLLKKKSSFKNRFIILLAILFAFYVGTSVSMTIHWFSDFVMGAILGFLVGREVGNKFKVIL